MEKGKNKLSCNWTLRFCDGDNVKQEENKKVFSIAACSMKNTSRRAFVLEKDFLVSLNVDESFNNGNKNIKLAIQTRSFSGD